MMRDDILDLKSAKRIAVMGGTFDPIHYGHLVAAEAVRHEYDTERVIFIPAGRPAFKAGEGITHSEHRYLMTVLATASNPCFGVSRLEIDRPGITYTIDTIRELRRLCGEETKIYFITGADAVFQILGWKDAEDLLGMCSFIAVTRPGYNKEKLRAQVADIKALHRSRIHFLEVPALAISSSDIRERAAGGKPVKYLLPPEVENYIIKHGLYQRAPLCPYSHEELLELLEKRLTPKRLRHSVGVAEEAVKLARHYQAGEEDANRARLAGILHDCAKCLDNDAMRAYCAERGIALEGVLNDKPNLAHGFAGAELAREEYGVADTEVLNAIRYHTFGRRGMSLVEKAVCLADFIEPNREDYDGLEDIRAAAYVDMDGALLLASKSAIEYKLRSGKRVYEGGYETIAWLEERVKTARERMHPIETARPRAKPMEE